MENFFSNLVNDIKGLFRKQNQSVLGIDIGSSSIKIVQLSNKGGRAILETYGELALGPYAGKNVGEATNLSNEVVIQAINDMLKEKEVNITTRSCALAIPFSSSFITVMEMPEMQQKQLEEMIPLEARKYIPVPISEVALDWYVVPRDKSPDHDSEQKTDFTGKPVSQKVEVLIVAIHNDTIIKYKEIVNRAALDASFFEIEIFSTMRSTLYQEIEPILIIDMGATTTKLYIVEKGILNSSHMVIRGGQSITNELSKSLGIPLASAEVLKRENGLLGVVNNIDIKDVMTITLDYIFTEANHFVLAYQKKYNKNVNKVFLVGGGSALKGVVDVAKRNFQTEVIPGDPFSKVVAPAFLEKILRETGPEFTVAVGVALRRLQELN